MKKSYFSNEGIWLKGNLHSHSQVSDGFFSPTELATLYADRGYDFLSMSDHNVYVPHSELPEERILLLTGVEHDIEYSKDKCVHIVGTGSLDKDETGTAYECRRYSKEEMTPQQLVDIMREDGQFVVLAHPIWSRMEPEEVLALEGYHAIEVYNNGTEHLCHGGNAEIYWDMLLRHGRRVLASCSDDVHVRDDLFGGWLMVKAKERSKQAILDAVFEGNYYVSMGPVIEDFGMEDDCVYIKCSPCREIHFVTYPPRGHSFFMEEKPLTEGVYRLKGRENYVRAVCVDEEGHSCWTNPIYFERS